jgi:hypothetical protein
MIQRSVQASQRRTDDATLTAAALAARDVTTDFSRGGTVTKDASRFVAFFNARVQGWLRIGETVGRDPVGVLLTTGLMAALSSALWHWNHDDEDEGRAFNEQIPPEERSTYWHLRLPTGGYLKFAKPFEWGYVPNLVEAALDYAQSKNPRALNRIRPDRETLKGTIFELLATGIAPLLEAAVNYDTFRRQHIVPVWEEAGDPRLQYSDWTSDTAKALGRLMHVSPAKIDHILYGYTASMGRAATQVVTDPVVRLLQGKDAPALPASPPQRWPVAGVFYRDESPSSRAESLQEFYDGLRALERYAADYRRWQQEDPAEAARFKAEQATQVWFTRHREMRAAARRLQAHRTRIDGIYAAPPERLTPPQKRERLNAVRAEMIAIARQALGKAPSRNVLEQMRPRAVNE